MEHQFTRQELYDRVWSKPMSHLVAELGTTTAILSTLLRRADIPTPPSGIGCGKSSENRSNSPLYRQHHPDVLSR
jgi:hypothetical protein